MNELLKTTIFVGVAVVLAGSAFFTTRDRQPANAADFADQGQQFFPDFKDALACTDLEVVDFDSSTATASRFRVMFKDKKWVIPSPLQLSGRRARPVVTDGGGDHGFDQGHDSLE